MFEDDSDLKLNIEIKDNRNTKDNSCFYEGLLLSLDVLIQMF